MSNETEHERSSRIRDAQINDRAQGGNKKPTYKTAAKKPSASKQANTPTSKPSQKPSSGLLNLPLGGVRDIAIGLAYGLIPALLAVILLPDVLKLFSLLILGIAGGTGYMLGAAPN